MQLKVSTDYAIRVVLYLSTVKRIVSAKELSTQLGIPSSFVYKVTKNLQDANIIRCEVGVQGGFEVIKSPSNITLYEIINIMQPTIKINRCLEEDKFCSRNATETCPVRNFYINMQNKVEETLKDMTIEKLLNE